MYASKDTVWISPDRRTRLEYNAGASTLDIYVDDTKVMALPNSQQSMTQTAVTAIGTTALTQVATSGIYGFASSTAGNALVTRVDQMQVDLDNLLTKLEATGLIAVDGN